MDSEMKDVMSEFETYKSKKILELKLDITYYQKKLNDIKFLLQVMESE